MKLKCGFLAVKAVLMAWNLATDLLRTSSNMFSELELAVGEQRLIYVSNASSIGQRRDPPGQQGVEHLYCELQEYS